MGSIITGDVTDQTDVLLPTDKTTVTQDTKKPEDEDEKTATLKPAESPKPN